MISPSYIELSRKALAKNISFLKKRIGENVIYSSVIKGNAYGHNIADFLPLAESCGVRHFSVFSADEAWHAYQARTRNSHIMIMGYIDKEELEWAIVKGISFYVFELDRLQAAVNMAKNLGIPARIHLELETGMNRTGLKGYQLKQAMETITENRDILQLDGVCTHYAGAESIANFVRIKNQITNFNSLSASLETAGLTPKFRHTACSAAAVRYPETVMDMVRFGIVQYGYWPSKETRMHYFLEEEENGHHLKRSPIKAILTWKSRIMSTKSVKRGEYVGYGTLYQTNRVQKIATVPVGYFHGFARNLSNLGHVLVHGRRALVLGIVNMNMIIIDVTNIPDVRKGDEVVVIGKQGKNENSVGSFSDLSRHLNYEVLVRIPSEIPRIIVD